MAYTEALLTTNNFKRPKVLKDNDALVVIIVRLIMLEPGRILGLPMDAGVGLVSKYRYCTEDDFDTLKVDIENQIAKYIPDAQGASVTIQFKQTEVFRDKKIMMIGIRLGNNIYAIGTDGENIYQNVDSNTRVISLSDLL